MRIIPKIDCGPWVSVGLLCLTVLILAIDDGILNLALPAISNEFEASTSELLWTINAYILSFAALLLTMGAMGDRFGRKRMFLAGLFLFGISSLAAALSTSMIMLITCRAIMGAGGAIVFPQTLSIIRAIFPDPKERAQAIGIWAGVFALGYGIGPVIGGALLEHFEWYSIFVLNIPIAVIASAGGYMFIRESKDMDAPKLDITGAVLSIIGLFVFVYGIIKAGEENWTDPSVIAWLVSGALVMVFFAFWEKTVKHPMMPLEFFRNMSFTGANVAMTLVSFGMAALLFFLSQYLQSVQGYSPLAAAIRLLPCASIVFVAAMIAPQITRFIGVKLPVSIGVLIGGGGLFVLSFATTATSYPMILLAMCLLGIGFGFAWSPAADSVMGSLPEARAGIGSAMDGTTQQIGGALGVAILGTTMNMVYLDKMEASGLAASLPEEAYEAIESSIQTAHIVAGQGQFPEDISRQIITESSNAFTSGMADAMLIGAIVMVVASVITLFVLPTCIRPPVQHR